MGDVDDRSVASHYLANATEQTLHLLETQVLGRLVKNEDLRLEGDGLRNLDNEPLLHGEVCDACSCIHTHLPRVKALLRPLWRVAKASDPLEADPNRHVLCDRQIRK